MRGSSVSWIEPLLYLTEWEADLQRDGIPPSLFWESDVGKWLVPTPERADIRIEAACYFLASPDGAQSAHAEVFRSSIQELVDMIEKAQQEDGYLIIYFTVVDKEGRFKNLRDMHEMCEFPSFFFGISSIHPFMAVRTRREADG